MGYVRIFATILCVMAPPWSGLAGAEQTVAGNVQKTAEDAQAAEDSGGFGVGDTLPAGEVHIISKPGLYGLGPEPENSKYAVSDGKLIRINPESGKVLSILRSQAKVLD